MAAYNHDREESTRFWAFIGRVVVSILVCFALIFAVLWGVDMRLRTDRLGERITILENRK